MMGKKIKIAIIGAGPCGMTLALALSKRDNFDITIYEKSPDHRNSPTFNPLRSYTIDITGHGYEAIKYLDIIDRFDKELIKFKGIRLAIFKPLIEIDELYEGEGWTGSRGDIVKILLDEISKIRELKQNIEIKFDTEATIEDPIKGTVSFKNRLESFDLVVGCDGASSSIRNFLKTNVKDFLVENYDNNNYSMMLAFDQNTSRLDSSFLYILGSPPYLAVAGAINGKQGKCTPLWFCQIAFSGPKKFNSLNDAKRFLLAHYSKDILLYASDSAIDEFYKQEGFSIGKSKFCSSLHAGRIVLLGDAASPFPPIGQGVNAAMQSAVILEQCIGQELNSFNNETNDRIISNSIKEFNKVWKPEADAISKISFNGLNLQSNHPLIIGKIKFFLLVFLHKIFKHDSMTNAKRRDMSYSEALKYQNKIEFFIYKFIFLIIMGLILPRLNWIV